MMDVLTENDNCLPESETLCQFLAWLFQKNGTRLTSEFLEFRFLHPKANEEIKRTELRKFCKKHNQYVQHFGATRKTSNDAKVMALSKWNNPAFKEKLRPFIPNVKTAGELWNIEPSISELEINCTQNTRFSRCEDWNVSSLTREWCKRLSTIAAEKIYTDESLRESLLSKFTNLDSMARERQMSATHLAVALVGKSVINGEKLTDDPTKLKIVQQCKLLCEKDLLFGRLADPKAISTMKKHGNKGENMMFSDLLMMGIPRELYKTEEEQLCFLNTPENVVSVDCGDGLTPPTSTAVLATPDVLFDVPIKFFDKDIRWIEVKNYVVVPGVSCDSRVEGLKKQVGKYLERFGPGLVLFTNDGFSKDLRDAMPEDVILASRFLGVKALGRKNRSLQQHLMQNISEFDRYWMPTHSPNKPVGHVLGGSWDKDKALERREAELKEAERLRKEVKELLSLEMEVFEYMNSLFVMPKSLEEKLESYLNLISLSKIEEKGKKALSKMKFILANIIKDPENQMYRRFNCSLISDIHFVEKFFITLGFKKCDQNNAYLIYDGGIDVKLSLANKLVVEMWNRVQGESSML